MAMTVRLTNELDAALQKIAEGRHTSKHSLVLQAVQDLVLANTKTDLVMASVDRTLTRDAELLRRLEEA